VVVLRLVGGDREGQWIEVVPPTEVHRWDGTTASSVTLIPTGVVEWDGNRCAEVYVPEDRLDEWRADVDEVIE